MANTTVSLTKRVKTDQGMRYLPVVLGADGRPRKDVVWETLDAESYELLGKDPSKPVAMRHLEGAYYLDFYQGAKRIRVSVGKNHERAWDAKLKKESELKAQAQGVVIVQPSAKGPSLDSSMADYLAEIKASKKPRTFLMYAKGLEYFRASCSKAHTAGVDRSDMLAYAAYLRDEAELAPRTVHNHFANTISFLKWAGREKIVRKADWPSYVEEEPETYEQDELDKFFAACSPEESRLFRFFLYSGFREQETTYLTWRDLLPTSAKVSHKPKYRWSPKAYKERTVPLPASFVADLLASRPSKAEPGDLVFPAVEGGPDGHFLRRLKAIVERSGLDPEAWWLHKLRSTFATTCLQNGVDLRTVQAWMGHTDLASTMRYLRPARGEKVQAQVEALWAFKR